MTPTLDEQIAFIEQVVRGWDDQGFEESARWYAAILATLREAKAREDSASWIADLILRDVQELPDRSSPEDAPDMMMVTVDELRDIVLRHVTTFEPAKAREAQQQESPFPTQFDCHYNGEWALCDKSSCKEEQRCTRRTGRNPFTEKWEAQQPVAEVVDGVLSVSRVPEGYTGPLYAAPVALEGWVMVPKEPTEEMLIAARDWSHKKYGQAIGHDAAQGCWNAMLAAAPKEPTK